MTAIFNAILDGVAAIGDGLVWLLPTSPFTGLQNSLDSDILGYINYFIPIDQMLSVGAAWLLAIGVYYLFQVVLRWAKAIQ
jgi:hypothetical protein